MKKNTISKLGTMALMMVGTVVTMVATGCDTDGPNWVNSFKVCATLTSDVIPENQLTNLENPEMTLRWTTQGFQHEETAPADVIGNQGCVMMPYLGVGVSEDFTVEVMEFSGTYKGEHYNGFDSAIDVVYDSTTDHLTVSGKVHLQKDAVEDVARTLVNKILGYGHIRVIGDKGEVLTSDKASKVLSDIMSKQSSQSGVTAGAAR